MPTGGQNLVLRPALSAFVVLGVMFGFLSFMAGLMAVSDKSMIPAFAACMIAWVLVYVWLFCLRLVVSAESLSYTTLFRGRRSYDFSEIRRISVESGIKEYSDRFKPLVRLAVTPIDGLGSVVYVNLKVFSRKDVKHLFDALREAFNRIGRPDAVKSL
jgi:hypothetical protein